MGVFYRADRRMWWIKFRGPDGRWISKPGAGTKAEASRLLRDVETRLAEPASGPASATTNELTVAMAAQTWLDGKHHLRDRRHYETAFVAHVLPEIGSRAVASITPADIRALLSKM